MPALGGGLARATAVGAVEVAVDGPVPRRCGHRPTLRCLRRRAGTPDLPHPSPDRVWQSRGRDRRTLMLLDAASLYFRAFFGVPDSMRRPDGTPVNAVRGLARLHRPAGRPTTGPTRLVACWDDDWRPAFRVDAIPSYKAHRVASARGADVEEVPGHAVARRCRSIEDVLAALGIARVGVAGYEADDVIGTLATAAGGPVDVVTGDRDLFQLVDDARDVRVLYTARKGVGDAERRRRGGGARRSTASRAGRTPTSPCCAATRQRRAARRRGRRRQDGGGADHGVRHLEAILLAALDDRRHDAGRRGPEEADAARDLPRRGPGGRRRCRRRPAARLRGRAPPARLPGPAARAQRALGARQPARPGARRERRGGEADSLAVSRACITLRSRAFSCASSRRAQGRQQLVVARSCPRSM